MAGKVSENSNFLGTIARVFSNLRKHLKSIPKSIPKTNSHFLNFIYYSFLFGCGLSLGVIIGVYIKYDCRNQFSLTTKSSTTTISLLDLPSSPPPLPVPLLESLSPSPPLLTSKPSSSLSPSQPYNHNNIVIANVETKSSCDDNVLPNVATSLLGLSPPSPQPPTLLLDSLTSQLPLLPPPSEPYVETESISADDDGHRYGVNEYVEPPKITMHGMDDQELLSRASMAPRIAQHQPPRVPKVAFLFLTKGSILLAPLWEKFFVGHQGKYSIYIHSHPSFNLSEAEPEGSVFYGRRIPSKIVEWGNFNMVEAERRLLANALLDYSNQRFVLLSEACIPLFNFSAVYSYLINSDRSFIESYDRDIPVCRGRYSTKMSPQITLEQWRKGSQWFEMDRELAMEVVSDQTYIPLFQKYCIMTCYPDEHYIQTFVTMKFTSKNTNRSVTWVDWSRSGPHPLRYVRPMVTVDFLRALRGGSRCMYNGKITSLCYLFARKFHPDSLVRLLKLAPKIMHFG